MSVSKYRYTPSCDGQPCPGDCDLCGKEETQSNDSNTLPNVSNTLDALDLISRKAAIDDIDSLYFDTIDDHDRAKEKIKRLPSAQPEIIRCKDCIYYDPPHIEKDGVRYEYKEMPEDAFGGPFTGLVHSEYGINIGGRCCKDYYVGYSEDKRVFRTEADFCSRAERRTDE